MKIHKVDFLNKLKQKPEREKRIIIWIIIVVIALVLSVVYVFYVQWKITDFQKKGFDLPTIEVKPLNLEVPNTLINDLGTIDKEIEEEKLLELEE